MEAAGVALGGVALLAPAVQACWTAYGVYINSQEYGREYQLALRKVMAQRQILEGLMRLKLEDLILGHSEDEKPIMEIIKGELVTMRIKFETCQKLINKLEVKSEVGKFSDSKLLVRKAHSAVAGSSQPRTNLKGRILNKTRKPAAQPSIRDTPALSPLAQSIYPPFSEQRRVGENALISQALSQPPIEASLAQEERDADIRQRSASLPKRVIWSLNQKKEFDDAIHELTTSNDNLRHLIQIRSLVDPGFLLRTTSRKQNQSHLESSQAFIERCHKALLSVNREPTGKTLEINIRLVENHENTQELWNDQGIPFRPGAAVVQLQAQRRGEGKESCLLLVDAFVNENCCATEPSPTNEGERIVSLNDAIALEPDIQSPDNFKMIGHIAPQASAEASYVIHQDVSARWMLRSSLAAELQNPNLQNRAFAAQHIALAALAALPYTQCIRERLTTPFPRPQHYRFYDYADELDTSEQQPIPYVSIGLGSKPPRPLTRGAGRFIPVKESINIPGIELGLLLFQIGSWTPLQYLGGYAALENMRCQALDSLGDVVKHAGLGFARIVEFCLRLKKEDHDSTLYQEVVMRLQQLDAELK